MKTFDAPTLAALQSHNIIAHRLVWIEARNAVTQAVEAIGFTSYEQNIDVTIDGVVRTYLGVGRLLEPSAIVSSKGLDVRPLEIRLSAVDDQVEDLVKGYSTRFAPVEIHRMLLDPETRGLVGAPHRIFRGTIDTITFPREAPGGVASCVLEVVSETRQLTRTLATKKSDESHKQRDGDRLRRYGDVSGSVDVYWMERRFSAPAEVPAAAPSTPATTTSPTRPDWEMENGR